MSTFLANPFSSPVVHFQNRLSTVHYPLSTLHYPQSTVHYPLSTVHCPPSWTKATPGFIEPREQSVFFLFQHHVPDAYVGFGLKFGIPAECPPNRVSRFRECAFTLSTDSM